MKGTQLLISDLLDGEGTTPDGKLVVDGFAGEAWRLNVFRTHGRIYEASASQMFNVPIELIKKGLRSSDPEVTKAMITAAEIFETVAERRKELTNENR